MDDKKLAFIYGEEDKDKNILEGQIVMLGDIYDDEEIHSNVLLDFARKNYKDTSVFERLNNRHSPETIAFFYTKLFNHIVFLNTTSKVPKHLKEYGKLGAFLLPNKISDKQKEALYKFLDEIEDYSISISYDLELVEGIIDEKCMRTTDNETPRELFDKFFQSKIKWKGLYYYGERNEL